MTFFYPSFSQNDINVLTYLILLYMSMYTYSINVLLLLFVDDWYLFLNRNTIQCNAVTLLQVAFVASFMMNMKKVIQYWYKFKIFKFLGAKYAIQYTILLLDYLGWWWIKVYKQCSFRIIKGFNIKHHPSNHNESYFLA